MPYKAFKRKGKFAVHKIDADGMPMGEPMGMHDTMEDAMKQVKALYAKEPKTESERIEEVGGHFNKSHDKQGRFAAGGGAAGGGAAGGASGGGVKQAEQDLADAETNEAEARRALATYKGSDSREAGMLANRYEQAKIKKEQAKARLEQAKRPKQQSLGGSYKQLPGGGVEWVPSGESAQESERLIEREISAEQRREYAEKGVALPDGSYFIANREDLGNAIQSIGRAGNRAKAMAHIKKRARALGLTNLLPEEWRESSASIRATYLSEPVSLTESTIDDEHMAVRGVTVIKAGFSSNRDRAGRPRYYSPDVLRDKGVTALEGALVYVNHPGRKEQENLPEGDALGVRGWYENVRWDEATQAIKGDQVFIDRVSTRNELFPIIKEAVARKPDLVQLSINAIGHMRIGKVGDQDAQIVEAIVKGEHPNRIDIVTRGAAGGSYDGAVLASDGEVFTNDLLAAMPFEQWREVRPEFVNQLKNEWKTARDSEMVSALRAALEESQDENKRLKEQHRAERDELAQLRCGALADRLLSESTLPYKLRETIRPELLGLEEAGMKEAIGRAMKQYQREPRAPVPVGGAGQRATVTVETQKPVTPPLLEAMGIPDARLVPQDGETPEAWAARVKQLRG